MKYKLFTILIIITFLISLLCFLKSNRKAEREYQINNQTDYEVILKPNIFFTKENLPASDYYVSKAIKDIKINFKYSLKARKDSLYTYSIKASLNSYADNGTKLVWHKDFNLEQRQSSKGKTLDINKTVTLDYDYYLNYAKAFAESFNLNAETYLNVKLALKVNNKNTYVQIAIPINEDIAEITQEDKSICEKPKISLTKIGFYSFFFIGIILITIRLSFRKEKEATLLKKYQDLFIAITSKPDLTHLQILYLTKLQDLINIALDNRTNIFYKDNIYYVIISNVCYLYKKE